MLKKTLKRKSRLLGRKSFSHRKWTSLHRQRVTPDDTESVSSHFPIRHAACDSALARPSVRLSMREWLHISRWLAVRIIGMSRAGKWLSGNKANTEPTRVKQTRRGQTIAAEKTGLLRNITEDSCTSSHITDSLLLPSAGMETRIRAACEMCPPPAPRQCHLVIRVIKWASPSCSHSSESVQEATNSSFPDEYWNNPDDHRLYLRARKNFSADSFLLAFGFTIWTRPNALDSFSWRLRARNPSQYLHTRAPPGCRTLSAKSAKVKHAVICFSWSISRTPLALGAMSLRMTSARPPGSSPSSLACVAGSVTSWLDRKWAPSSGGMFSRSMPTTVPRGSAGSVTEKNCQL